MTPPLAALTGANGFLGSHIADRLLERGFAVRAGVRAGSDLRWLAGKPIETITLDWAAPADGEAGLDRLLDGAAAVLHCAGVIRAPDEAGYARGNVETTRRLVATAGRHSSVRTLLLVSSLAASGPSTPGRPRREDDPPAPINPYGRSKLAAERLLEGGLPVRAVVLRPPALYGPRDHAWLMMFRLAARGWSVRLSGACEPVSLVDGRDAAAAAVALVESPAAAGSYFVDDGRGYGWREITDALAAASGRRLTTLRAPLGALRAAARVIGPRRAARSALLNPERLGTFAAPAWLCSGERLRRDTGFEAERDLERGFRETLEFYRRAGWV